MIYFILNDRAGALKIGVATDPQARLRGLQTASPDPLRLVGAVPGGFDEERAWHERWSHLRRSGEWFDIDDELMTAVRVAIVALIDSGRDVPGPFLLLAHAEPRLMDLYREAVGLRAAATLDDRFCANGAWYGYAGHPGIKKRLIWLVGWLVRDTRPDLGTMDAYNVAYRTIYDALPDCRVGCACRTFLDACVGPEAAALICAL